MHRWLRLHHVHRHRVAAHSAGTILILAGVAVVIIGVALALFDWTGVPADETATTTGAFVRNGPWPTCDDTVAFEAGGRRYTTQVRSLAANGGYAPAGSFCEHHRIGSQVSVAYSPTSPAHASVQFNEPVVKWIAFLLLGALFVFFGWLFIPPREEHPDPLSQNGSPAPVAPV
jgi:hypothetical protein